MTIPKYNIATHRVLSGYFSSRTHGFQKFSLTPNCIGQNSINGSKHVLVQNIIICQVIATNSSTCDLSQILM